MSALGETIQIAVMATFFATLIAMPLALAGSQTIAPRWMNLTTRMILNIIRTLPSLIWALIAVAVVGANPLAGVIGLTFTASAIWENSLATLLNPSTQKFRTACAS